MPIGQRLQELLGIAKETGQQLVSHVKQSVQEVVESDKPLEVMGGRLAKGLQEMVPTEEAPLGGFGFGGIIGKSTRLIKTKTGEDIKLIHDPEEGSVFAYNVKEKLIGEVNIAPLFGYTLKDAPTQAAWMGVSKEYQRKGINTEMQQFLMDLYPKYTPISHTLTEEGAAWAKTASSSFYKRNKDVREEVSRLREGRNKILNEKLEKPDAIK